MKYAPKPVRCSACGNIYTARLQSVRSLCPECREARNRECRKLYMRRKRDKYRKAMTESMAAGKRAVGDAGPYRDEGRNGTEAVPYGDGGEAVGDAGPYGDGGEAVGDAGPYGDGGEAVGDGGEAERK